MNQINIYYFKSRIGELIAGSFDGRLCLMDFRYRKMRQIIDSRIKRGLAAEFIVRTDDVVREAEKELDEYLKGTRMDFEVPILTVGTDFQKKVWDKLMRVPYGATATYGELAAVLEKGSSVRAVAGANAANAIAVIIPCHRIIGKDGELIGYGGGLAVKKRLLNLEAENLPSNA